MPTRSLAPPATALKNGMPDLGASGVNRKSGIEPSSRMAADISATTRSGSWVVESRPNSGAAGTQPQATLPGSAKAQAVKASATTDTKLPSASARPDALCAAPTPAARISNELWITSE